MCFADELPDSARRLRPLRTRHMGVLSCTWGWPGSALPFGPGVAQAGATLRGRAPPHPALHAEVERRERMVEREQESEREREGERERGGEGEGEREGKLAAAHSAVDVLA